MRKATPNMIGQRNAAWGAGALKLNKAELISIVVTIIFVAATVFATLWQNGSGAAVTVSLQDPDSAVSVSVSPSVSVSGSSSPSASAVVPAAATAAVSSPRALININTASAAELDSLPGIGEKIAQKILDYRQTHGPFRKISDIMNVSGIGAAKYANIKGLITVQKGDGQ